MSERQEDNDGPPVSVGLSPILEASSKKEDDINYSASSPPPRYPLSEASSSNTQRPPPFSSLYTSTTEAVEAYKLAVTEAGASTSAPAYAAQAPDPTESPFEPAFSSDAVADTKAALPPDTKSESSKKEEDSEPPPAYSEGSSPLDSFTYLMAAAGGAASIITQVQQGGPGGLNTLGGEEQDIWLGKHISALIISLLQMSVQMKISQWTFGMSLNLKLHMRLLMI